MLSKKDKFLILFTSAIVLSTIAWLSLSLIIINRDQKIAKPAYVIGRAEAAGKRISESNFQTNQQALSAKPGQIYLPILLYHKTPSDFEEQMQKIKSTGHTPVTMDEAMQIINRKIQGPKKPIAITFDDGFSDQLRAFEVLKKYGFKSTSYIITGGNLSSFCIGASKENSKGCGDSYLNWEEIINLSNSGLVEIGSHTIDHLQLSSLDENSQRFQILESKKILESKLGKKVNSFAFPYGKYNQSTLNIVKESGYTNATTVFASEYQDSEKIFLLNRIRNTRDLR